MSNIKLISHDILVFKFLTLKEWENTSNALLYETVSGYPEIFIPCYNKFVIKLSGTCMLFWLEIDAKLRSDCWGNLRKSINFYGPEIIWKSMVFWWFQGE